MSENDKDTCIEKDSNLFSNIIGNQIVLGFLATVLVLIIEYHSGLFQVSQSSQYSISPVWSGLSIFTVIASFTSIIKLAYISINSHKYFREEFSLTAVFTIGCLTIALGLSFFGKLMVWYPLVAISYILSGQKIDAPQPSSIESYVVLLLITALEYKIASDRQKNWDGLKSEQQYNLDQKGESNGILSEGICELKRILNRAGALKKYLAPDTNQFFNLEQSEDLISKSWMKQARELVRLSSSSYVIDEYSGWHDKQGCWVGQNVNTGKLFFLYPAQSILSNQDLDNFVSYSKDFAQSQNSQISELIVAFRDNNDRQATPIDLYTAY